VAGLGRKRDGHAKSWQQELMSRHGEYAVTDDSPAYDHDCISCGGRCCFNNDVIIGPHDIWRIVTGKDARALGIRTSHDLFRKSNRDGLPLLNYYFGPESGVPVASINMRRLGEEGTVCPFLAPVYVAGSEAEAANLDRESLKKLGTLKAEDGSPTGLCALENSKPTICRAFPLGRLGLSKEDEKEPPRMGYVWAEGERCRKYRADGKPMTVGEYVSKWGLDEAYRQSDLTMDWMREVRQVRGEKERFSLGILFYNFDLAAVLKAGPGFSRKEYAAKAEKLRPDSFEEIHTAQMRLVRSVLRE
jgi:Fe-S-cluster containining protein